MPFHYESSVDPRQSGTIADLILRRGDIAAHAAQQNGAIWGGAVQNIGQMIGALPGQIALGKRAELQDQIGAQQLQDMKANAAERVTQHAEQETARDQALTSQIGLALHDRLRPDDPTNNLVAMQEALDAAEHHKLITPEQAQQFGAMASADPTKIPEVAKSWAGLTAAGRAEIEKTITAKPGEVTTSRWDGSPVGAPLPEARKTAAELAADAANPKSPTQAQSATALDLMRPPRPEPVPRPLDQQLFEAIAKGDTKTADQIKQTLRTRAEATKDPGQVKLANELGALRAEEAKARLDGLKDKNKPADIEPDIQTTVAGRKYIDLSQYSGEHREKARAAAGAAGVVGVSKEQANALQEIDNARMNQHAILDQIGDLLPKGVGGRAVASVTVPLEKLFQTNDQIAAFNTWRTSAIQTLRATAGSKGLRINQAEIAQAIENDIPKLTDTVGVAQQKLKNIETMLENGERSILTRDRSVPAPMTGPATPPPLTPGLQRLSERK
jgi:hypothetical protein